MKSLHKVGLHSNTLGMIYTFFNHKLTKFFTSVIQTDTIFLSVPYVGLALPFHAYVFPEIIHLRNFDDMDYNKHTV